MSIGGSTVGIDLLAVPPMDARFHVLTGWIAAAVYGAIALGLMLWALRRRERWPIVAAMLVGGVCTSLIEPLLDVMSGAYHPNLGQPRMFTLMGRGIPLWVVLCYGLYYGGFGSLNLLALNKGLTRRGVWLWFLVPLIGDVVLEQVMLSRDLYSYYGNQALVVLRFPLYQPAGNAVGELFGVMTMFFLYPWLSKTWHYFVAACAAMPLCGVMGFSVVTWPMDYAVHSTWPNAVVQSCGAVSWALAGLMLFCVSFLVAVDSPLRSSGRLTLR